MAATEKNYASFSEEVFCQNDTEEYSAYSSGVSLFAHASDIARGNSKSGRHVSAGSPTCEVHWGQLCSRLYVSHRDLKTERDSIDLAERQEVNMNKPDLLGDG